MTKIDFKAADKDCKTVASSLADDPEFVRAVVQDTLNAVMEAEMSELLGVAPPANRVGGLDST